MQERSRREPPEISPLSQGNSTFVVSYGLVLPGKPYNFSVRLRFGDFTIDRSSRTLHRGEIVLSIQPKHFELLWLLLERRPSAVSKQEIYRRLWPDVVVEEANLHNIVSDLRKLLEDRAHRSIRTVHRYGYAFAADAKEEVTDGRPSPFELRIGERAFPLRQGENLIGRDENADVLLDAPDISRLHARISIGNEGASIEDLGSKNGTFVGTRRVAQVVEVNDGDPIVFASIAAIFCRRRSRGMTITRR